MARISIQRSDFNAVLLLKESPWKLSPMSYILDKQRDDMKFARQVGEVIAKADDLPIWYFPKSTAKLIQGMFSNPKTEKIMYDNLMHIPETRCIMHVDHSKHNPLTIVCEFKKEQVQDEHGDPHKKMGLSLLFINTKGQMMHYVKCYIYEVLKREDGTVFLSCYYIYPDQTINDEDIEESQANRDSYPLIKMVMDRILFHTFVEIEEVVVNSKNKKRKGNKAARAISKVPYDVTVIDSSWYRSIVGDGTTDVDPYFRMQPYGPKMTLRRLQMIKGFVRSKYNRVAKKVQS